MGTHAYWEPVQRRVHYLGDDLKIALREKYGYPLKCVLHYDDLPFLIQLSASGLANAEKLIAAINKHGPIDVGES